MSTEALILFLTVVAFASYVQTVTGFALGMIIMGVVTGMDLAPIAFTSAVISLLALSNCAFALPGAHRHINWRATLAAVVGLFPALIAGVLLLDHLSSSASHILQAILGAAIVYGGLSIAFKPTPRAECSGPVGFMVSGMFGGAFGGLFSIAGPPLVYQFYRQPMSLLAIRNSLLALFASMNAGRTLLIGSQGQLNSDVLLLSLLSLPAVAMATAAGRRYPPPLSDTAMRRIAFILLVVIGVSLIASALPKTGLSY